MIKDSQGKLASRGLVDAIHAGELAGIETFEDPTFGFAVPKRCPGVPEEILNPKAPWADAAAYDQTAQKLAKLFRENFEKYAEGASAKVKAAGPKA